MGLFEGGIMLTKVKSSYDVVLWSFYKGVFFVRTLVFEVVDERVVETGLKPVS